LVPKDHVSDVHWLSPSEQIKCDMALKAWETNLEEIKRLAREVNESCLEALASLEEGLIDFEGNVISKSLGQIDIEKNQYNSKTSKDEALTIIHKMN
jgi:hypothetical protein